MKKAILERAREVFDVEIEGLVAVRDNLGESFEQLVHRCMDVINAGGKLVFTGVGKSGYIGKKIAATLSSVGSPSVFMHPVEARHGDLGIIQKHDLLIALSYSGETEELLVVLTPAKRLGVELVSITSSTGSTLGKMSDLVVEMPVPREACPFNLRAGVHQERLRPASSRRRNRPHGDHAGVGHHARCGAFGDRRSRYKGA